MRHLDAAAEEGLLRGNLSREEAADLARHLAAPCEVCEAFLAERGSADGLDGRVEASLGALGPPGAPGNDLEFARIERRLRDLARPSRRPARAFTGLAGAAAAALLAAGLAGLLLPRPPPDRPDRPAWDGLKGTARAIPVRLRFVVVAPEPGGRPSLEKGVPGQAVSPSAALQFEVEAMRPASIALVRVAARGAPEIFWAERVDVGRTSVSVAGRPAAYPLAELSGAQRFVLVASEERLDEGRAVAAAAALAPPVRSAPDLPALHGLSLDVVEVEVR